LAGSPDAIWCWRTDGIITQWNPAAERLLGFEASEIAGSSLLDLVPKAERSAAQNMVDRVSTGESYGHFETIRVSRDGRALAVEITVVPLRDQKGSVVGGATFCRDVSERKSVADSLFRTVRELGTLFHLTERLQAARSPQEVHQAALEAITEALECDRASILLFDSSSVMRFVAWKGISEQYRKAVDSHSPWTPETFDATPIFVPDIREANEPGALKTVIEGEGIRGLAFIPLVRNGRVIGKFMTYYRDPHQFSERETRLASTIARQLSLSLDRIMAEEQLRESELRFRLMSEHAPVMIWISDAAGKCLHLNRLLRSFWGLKEAAIPDFDWSATIHPDDVQAVGEQIGLQSRKGPGRAQGAVPQRHRRIPRAGNPCASSHWSFRRIPRDDRRQRRYHPERGIRGRTPPNRRGIAGNEYRPAGKRRTIAAGYRQRGRRLLGCR